MFWTFCAPKGGVGVSTIAAAVAIRACADRRVLVVDFGGDLPDLFGITPPETPGVCDWLGGDPSVGPDALFELAVPVDDRLSVLPAGSPTPTVVPERAAALVAATRSEADLVVADVGRIDPAPFAWQQLVANAADRRTLVVRACYLALRRAVRCPLALDDLIEVVEGGRALRTVDIEGVFGRPVDDTVPYDPRIARAADAGLLLGRCPRSLRRVADTLLAASRSEDAA